MIRSWILYILTVGVVFVFTILYGKQSGFLLCLLTVLLPLIYASSYDYFGFSDGDSIAPRRGKVSKGKYKMLDVRIPGWKCAHPGKSLIHML